MSKAAETHTFRRLKTPSRCRECDSYVYFHGFECFEVSMLKSYFINFNYHLNNMVFLQCKAKKVCVLLNAAVTQVLSCWLFELHSNICQQYIRLHNRVVEVCIIEKIEYFGLQCYQFITHTVTFRKL